MTARVIPEAVLSSMLLKMFKFSPIAMSISTSDGEESSYLMVNQAYLDLTGNTWEAISGRRLTAKAAIPSPGFERRHQMLRETGAYVGEEVNIRHADGSILPTLISCQRTIVDGINYDLEMIVDISDRVKEEHRQRAKLLDMASTDTLSSLPNRRAFEDYLAHQLAQPVSSGTLVLAYIDLNGFKQLNDSLGHAAGDEAIRVIGARMLAAKRTSDFVARLGGDEFALILRVEGVLPDESLLARLNRVFLPFEINGQAIQLGASVGLTEQHGDDTAEALVHRADALMYEAKRAREGAGVFLRSDRGEEDQAAGADLSGTSGPSTYTAT